MTKLLGKIANYRARIKKYIACKKSEKFHDLKHGTGNTAVAVLFVLVATQFLFMKVIADAGELTARSLLDCSNQIRMEQGGNPIYFNNNLHSAAEFKLRDMDYFGYWAHQNPITGATPWDFIDASGYYYLTAGENLAIGYEDSQQVCEAWANSQVHRDNILNPTFQEMGLAIDKANLHKNGKGLLVVQMFGSRKDFVQPEEDYSTYIAPETDIPGQTPITGTTSVKGEFTSKNTTFQGGWNWIAENIIFFVIIFAYFFVRSVVVCNRQEKGKTKTRCIAMLSSFLIMASISIIILYFNNLII